MLWNFNRFDINSSIFVKEAWEAKKYAFVADYIRLYAVYHFGGIYLDMDIEIVKSFDALLNSDIMFARSNDIEKNVESGCFGAERHSPYIKRVLDYYADRHFVKPDGTYDTYPIPLIMRDIFHVLFPHIESRFYTSDFFTVKSSLSKKIIITDNTYCIHHFNASWLSETEKNNNRTRYTIRRIFGTNVFSRLIIMVVFVIKRIKRTSLSSAFVYYARKIRNKSAPAYNSSVEQWLKLQKGN
jgi:mannosyltransferase OCH1-like enzyme